MIKIDWAGRNLGKEVSLEIHYKASLPYFYSFQKSSRKILKKAQHHGVFGKNGSVHKLCCKKHCYFACFFTVDAVFTVDVAFTVACHTVVFFFPLLFFMFLAVASCLFLVFLVFCCVPYFVLLVANMFIIIIYNMCKHIYKRNFVYN